MKKNKKHPFIEGQYEVPYGKICSGIEVNAKNCREKCEYYCGHFIGMHLKREDQVVYFTQLYVRG